MTRPLSTVALPVALLKLLPVIFSSKTLYILGAGTSVKYIRPKYELYEIAKTKIDEWLLSPIFVPANNIQLSDSEKHRFQIQGSKHVIHETFDGKLLINETNMDFRDIVIHSNPEVLDLICALTYSISIIPTYCPEYQILNQANPYSVVVNMNHDYLATSFICKNIKNIPLHGSISPSIRSIIKNHAAHILDHGTSSLYLRNMILSTKENEAILKHDEYKDFILELEKNDFKYLVIIGYSFFRKNDNDIYDVVTYDLIRSYIYNHNCKIIIIDINTDYVSDILSKSTGNLMIESFKINWSCFTHAFLQTGRIKNNITWKYSAVDLIRFTKYYYYYEYYFEQIDHNSDFLKSIPPMKKSHAL